MSFPMSPPGAPAPPPDFFEMLRRLIEGTPNAGSARPHAGPPPPSTVPPAQGNDPLAFLQRLTGAGRGAPPPPPPPPSAGPGTAPRPPLAGPPDLTGPAVLPGGAPPPPGLPGAGTGPGLPFNRQRLPGPVDPSTGSMPGGPASLLANRAAASQPDAAMRAYLRQRGIGEMNPLGEMYMGLAGPLARAYDISAGQVQAGPGGLAATNEDRLAFQQGYLDAMQTTDPAGREQFSQLRGTLKAQIRASLAMPTSEIGQAARQAWADGSRYGKDKYWDDFIEPALVASDATPLFMKAKQNEYAQHMRDWQVLTYQAAAQGGQAPDFLDYLATVGFGLD